MSLFRLRRVLIIVVYGKINKLDQQIWDLGQIFCLDVNLPGDVDRHILLSGTGEHPEELVQGGGQELDHHMTLHGMQTLRCV